MLTAPGSSATTVVVVGDRIVAVGEDAVRASVGAAGVRSVDLAGRLVTPAFVDAHLHAVQTGQLTTGLDLHGVGSREELLDLVAARLARSGLTVLLGQGWDERSWPDPRPPTRAELDRAGGASVPVYLARVDVHSAVVSSRKLADRVPGLAADVGSGPTAGSGRRRTTGAGWVRSTTWSATPIAGPQPVPRWPPRRSSGSGTVHELGGPSSPSARTRIVARVVDAGGELGLRWSHTGVSRPRRR